MMQLATIDVFAAGEEWARLRRPGVVEMIDKRVGQARPGSSLKTMRGNLTDWVKLHDRYETTAGDCCQDWCSI